jgi:uncharacterized protein (TIGR00255 family)
MLRSMTGYGTGRVPLEDGSLVVEIRAVNHRFADVRLRLQGALGEHAAIAEETARRLLERGRIELGARIEGEQEQVVELDWRRARSAFAQLAALRDELRPEEPVPLTLLSAVPELFRAARPMSPQAIESALAAATRSACAAVEEMRRREGQALATDLRGHLDDLATQLDALRARLPDLVEAYHQRLRERVARLVDDVANRLDESRLEHELALFADRTDVSEELARLESHSEQFAELMRSDGSSVGRRLDFLLQEMGREINTIGAKVADADATRIVVEAKACIERMREQVQNVL